MSFDQEKANFWLVACVIGWLLLMAGEYESWCLFFSIDQTKECPRDDKFAELINTILASALAYAAGRSSKG